MRIYFEREARAQARKDIVKGMADAIGIIKGMADT